MKAHRGAVWLGQDGWGKTIGGLARAMLRGTRKLAFKFTLTMADYNLIRIPKRLAAMA